MSAYRPTLAHDRLLTSESEAIKTLSRESQYRGDTVSTPENAIIECGQKEFILRSFFSL
jgi:hypothetical protein